MAEAKPNFGEPEDNPPPQGSDETITLTRAELYKLLDERDQKHAEELAAVRAKLPVALVPAHAGGPGIDRHQASWSLAEQEHAARGEELDHWV